MIGVITASRAPDDLLNINKVQYEYDLNVVGPQFSTIPVRHIVRADAFGSTDESNDTPLRVGNRCLVWFPSDDMNDGVIVCCLRNRQAKMDKADGTYWLTRFNQVEQKVDQFGHWSLKLDQGEFMKVDKAKMTISNSTGEQVVLDKKGKSIVIRAGSDEEIQVDPEAKTIYVVAGKDWKTKLGGNMIVDAVGDVTINCANANVNAKSKASVKAASVDVTASGKATVKAATIELNGRTGDVLTNMTDPIVDYITGIPTIGVLTVKAGQG